MGQLRDAYEWAQRYKNDAIDTLTPGLGGDQIDSVLAATAEQLPDADQVEAGANTLAGLLWLAKMCEDFMPEADVEELLDVPNEVAVNTNGNIKFAAAALTTEQAVTAGVGAGLFTGLLMGLHIATERKEDAGTEGHG